MPFTDISALLEYSGATEAEWDDISIPLSNNMLAYAKDTKIFKIGNGSDTFSQLPVAFAFDDLKDAGELIDKFPELSEEDAGRLVIVTPGGNGYTLSNYKLEDIALHSEAVNLLEGKADIDHLHPGTYVTPEEASGILSDDQRLDYDSQDLVSYLLLKRLDKAERDLLKTPDGYADEFNTEEGISDTNMTYDGAKYIQGESAANIVSVVKTASNDVDYTRMFIRGQIDGDVRDDYLLEMSRDGGDTWSKVTIEKSPMSTSDIDVITGVCDFDRVDKRDVMDLSTGDIEDVKGDISDFIVDESGRGHFSSSIHNRIEPGCTVVTANGEAKVYYISDSGDTESSVLFLGELEPGTYPISQIRGVSAGDDLQLNKIEHIVEGEVIYKADVPVAIYRHTTTLYQDKIYVIGGHDSNNALNTTYIYDITTDTWLQGTDIPIAIRQHTAILHQDKIYVIGGNDGSDLLNTIYIYDIATDSWSQDIDMPIPISHHTATLYQDQIYVIGGRNSNGTSVNTTYIYDIASDSWSQGTNMPIAIRQHTATLYEDKIYIIGGWDGSDLNTTYIYDIANDSWSQGTDLPVAIRNHTVALYQDQIYIVGGRYGGNNNVNTIHIYDIANDSWSQGTSLPTNLDFADSIIYRDQIYIVGGRISNNNELDTTYTYALSTIAIPTVRHTTIYPLDEFYTLDKVHPVSDNENYYSFRFGDTFKIYRDYRWIDIVRLNGSTWQYRNGSLWHNASLNSPQTAISQAVGVSGNRMTIDAILSLKSSDFKGTFPSEISITLKGDKYNIPKVSNLSVVGSESVDIPTGNQIQWKFSASNDKAVTLHGVRLIWASE